MSRASGEITSEFTEPVRNFVYGRANGLEGAPHGTTERAGYPDALLGRLLGEVDAKSSFDGGGLIEPLKKALAERALNAEMDHHDGGSGNSRNGYGKKTVLTEDVSLELSIPRDR